ncbi:MAG: MCE family protein [Lentisphaeria bacterium]|nr:MCE family protein [Lentisphaeria bacterium]
MQETNKFKLGLFVIAAIIVLIAAVFSMGMFEQLQPKAHMVTYVEESVQGLTTGSSVKYKGVPIGNVCGITIVVDSNEIRIDIEIDLSKIQKRTQNSITGTRELGLEQFYEYMLKDTENGLACRIEPDGITGSKYVEINFFKDEKVTVSRRKAILRNGIIYMPSTPSMMANLRTNIFEILTSIAAIDFKGISHQTNELLKRANQTLDRAKLDQLSGNANEVIRKLDLTITNLNQALDEKQMRKTVKDMESAIQSIRSLAVQITETMEKANLAETSSDIRQLSKSLKDSSDSLQTSLQKANNTMDSITDLVRYMNDNPASLIRGRGTSKTEE